MGHTKMHAKNQSTDIFSLTRIYEFYSLFLFFDLAITPKQEKQGTNNSMNNHRGLINVYGKNNMIGIFHFKKYMLF